MTIYDLTLPRLGGGTIKLDGYRGQPMLIVNTASKCGFTPQYAALQRLWEQNQPAGLVVLGVPSNDFRGQEPGSDAEIGGFCQKTYGVTFPMASKVHVVGPDKHPLFQLLAESGGVFSRPRWNFYKFVIGRDGTLVTWFSSLTSPASRRLARAVDAALKHDV